MVFVHPCFFELTIVTIRSLAAELSSLARAARIGVNYAAVGLAGGRSARERVDPAGGRGIRENGRSVRRAPSRRWH